MAGLVGCEAVPPASQSLPGWHYLHNRCRHLDREFPLVRAESGRICSSRVRLSRRRLGVPSEHVLVWERKNIQPQKDRAILQLARQEAEYSLYLLKRFASYELLRRHEALHSHNTASGRSQCRGAVS